MNQLVIIVFVSWLAGMTAFAGGLLTKLPFGSDTEHRGEVFHGVIAFGGGILIAAVAFVMAPEAIAILSPIALAITFCSGGLIFCALDAIISKGTGSKAQFMAMLLDFIPEAIALGALFGHSKKAGILLALFIGAQNLPEGFNAHRENVAAGTSEKASLLTLLLVSLCGPIAACSGYLFLRDHQIITVCMMSAAGGGILYLIFQDIAPQAKLRRHWIPPLGAVLGFAVGMIGKKLLG